MGGMGGRRNCPHLPLGPHLLCPTPFWEQWSLLFGEQALLCSLPAASPSLSLSSLLYLTMSPLLFLTSISPLLTHLTHTILYFLHTLHTHTREGLPMLFPAFFSSSLEIYTPIYFGKEHGYGKPLPYYKIFISSSSPLLPPSIQFEW